MNKKNIDIYMNIKNKVCHGNKQNCSLFISIKIKYTTVMKYNIVFKILNNYHLLNSLIQYYNNDNHCIM